MSGAVDDTLRKFHASLNVTDLQRSIDFYRVLLGTEPAKVRADYAKFELAEPALVLSLIPGQPGAGGNLNHVGLRVRTAEELVDIQQRLEAAGLHTEREDGVECCYARQTKFWITDPDRALWEIYVFHEDVDEHGHGAPPRAEQVQVANLSKHAPRAWEHRLGEAIPSRIPFDDNSLYEVRLSGSVNAAPEAANRTALMPEILRVLRPGGTVYIHGLAGDRDTDSKPMLPGPARAVEHVPATRGVVEELTRAGFVAIQIEQLSQAAHFVVDGVPMRELRIAAQKGGYRPQTAAHQAVYLGPMAEVIDDFGNVFRRGALTPLNIHDWQVLSKGPSASAFLFLEPGTAKPEAACDRSAPATAGAVSA